MINSFCYRSLSFSHEYNLSRTTEISTLLAQVTQASCFNDFFLFFLRNDFFLDVLNLLDVYKTVARDGHLHFQTITFFTALI
jgi:hypothetical protein